MPNDKKSIMRDGYYADPNLSEIATSTGSYRRGVIAGNDRDWDTALKMGQRALRMDPKNFDNMMLVNRATIEGRRKAIKNGMSK